MNTPIQAEAVRPTPESTPLNEAAWRAWQARGREREERNYSRRVNAIKWLSLASILAAVIAGLWESAGEYDIPLRFLIAAGGVAMMVHALRTRQFSFAVAFGAVAILYNPVAPLFAFSGQWERALMVGTALPVIASLTVPSEKAVRHV